MLDADETISGASRLKDLAVQHEHDAYAFPRKRWLDLDMTQQTEVDAYPDWQVRFFRNDPDYIWKRHLHEFFHGAAVHHVDKGPILHHFQDVFKDAERNRIRRELYRELAKEVNCAPEEEKLFKQYE